MIRVLRFRRNEAKRIHIYLETNLGYSRYSNDIYIGILRIKMNDNLRDNGGRAGGLSRKIGSDLLLWKSIPGNSHIIFFYSILEPTSVFILSDVQSRAYGTDGESGL